GKAWGVEPYPGGLPVLFAQGVSDLVIRELDWQRPVPLPAGWNTQALCLEKCERSSVRET
ncbi:hypothetical protein CWN50_13305, partial [Klebsiella michiganensis]